MIDKIKLVVGFDQREAIAYHTFIQSVVEKCTIPIEIIPLASNTLSMYEETHNDRSNDFIYSRFMTPFLNNFEGWAIFADGDMICNADFKELWDKKDPSKAVMVAKHNYLSRFSKKYLGNINQNYPRKNWSSLILWNCAHPKHKILTPDFISNQTGKFLHRFSWLEDEDIGDLPKDWNWLAIEYPENKNAKLIHYTLGTPCFKEYWDCDMSDIWHANQKRVLSGMKI